MDIRGAPSDVGRPLRRFLKNVRRFRSRPLPGARVWSGAMAGVGLAAALVWAAMSSQVFAPAGPLSFLLGISGGLLVAALLGGFLTLISILLSRVPLGYGWAVSAAFPLLLYAYLTASLALGMVAVVGGILVLSSLVGAGTAAVTSPRWEVLPGWQRAVAISGLALGLLGLLGGGALLLTDGFDSSDPINAAAQSAANVTPLALPDPSQPGAYAVRTLTYGNGEDRHRPEYGGEAALLTTSVDASRLLEGWTDRRRAYWVSVPRRCPATGGCGTLRVRALSLSYSSSTATI